MVGFYIQTEKRCQILRGSKAALIRHAATFRDTATFVFSTTVEKQQIYNTFKTLMSLSPLENLLSLLFRDMDSKVTQGLKDFLRIDSACVTRTVHKWVKWGFYLHIQSLLSPVRKGNYCFCEDIPSYLHSHVLLLQHQLNMVLYNNLFYQTLHQSFRSLWLWSLSFRVCSFHAKFFWYCRLTVWAQVSRHCYCVICDVPWTAKHLYGQSTYRDPCWMEVWNNRKSTELCHVHGNSQSKV